MNYLFYFSPRHQWSLNKQFRAIGERYQRQYINGIEFTELKPIGSDKQVKAYKDNVNVYTGNIARISFNKGKVLLWSDSVLN